MLGKRYFHLDYPVADKELQRWKPVLLAPDQVRKRAFYPFLKIVKERKRFANDTEGVRRIHPEGPKKRDICYAAHHDALFFSWYGFQLESLLEPKLAALGLDDCVLAYRAKGKNNIHFAKMVFDYIATQPACVALAFDVTKFFDTLNHRLLKQAWVALLEVEELPADHYTIFKAMTRFRTVAVTAIEEALGPEKTKECFRQKRFVFPEQFRTQLLPKQVANKEPLGIPQGAPLSAVLSNLYMVTLDVALQKVAQACGGIYRRYCDDLLFVVPPGQEVVAEVAVRRELAELQLVLNEKKTERRFFTQNPAQVITCMDERGKPASLQYLGLEFCGKTVLLRSSSLARYHQRLRRGVRKAVRMAKGQRGLQGGKVFKRALYRRFSHLGKFNFIRYAKRAHHITGSQAIKKQVRGSIELINKLVDQEIKRQEYIAAQLATRKASAVMRTWIMD
ncbi:MAG TPA: antiviral reverse transcriptase Drt2 [Hymenobacter sp.]|uniref:antiviral reverse transcriptase Drt2 n=1 Tax=Hymenobacter sp. TaxID=1898978 RepID=UPI002D7E85CA|nr:antiviral reverse transcriptase Drt2 [Hymenobacter sp.]HET9503043.1 antiviral reverse transcriptase Drt2 [Hymenobacter sp.]